MKEQFPKNKYPEDEIIKMLEFLVDNIFMILGKGLLADRQQPMAMGTKCAFLVADVFLCSFEAESFQSIIPAGQKHHLGTISRTDTSMMYWPH